MQSPRRISIWELIQFATACAVLAFASAAIRLLPFRMLVRTMEWGRASREDQAEMIAEHVATAVRRAAARLPWRTACFDRGLAAHWMMRWSGVPSILHYGIDPRDEELSAHVWVSLGGRILIGEEEAGRHAEVTSFPMRPGGQRS